MVTQNNRKKLKEFRDSLKKVNNYPLQKLPVSKRIISLNGGCSTDDEEDKD